HAARELPRILRAVVPQPDQTQVLLHDLSPPRRGHARDAQAEGDVLLGGQPRKERGVRVLEEHDAIPARARDGCAVEPQVTVRRRLEAGQDVQQRGLAAATRPEEAEQLALADVEVDASEDARGAGAAAEDERLVETVDRQHRRRDGSTSGTPTTRARA